MFGEEFRLMLQEGHLASSSIRGGINYICKANIDDTKRGMFYSGLFQLSIGFERLMKIVVILQHKIDHDNKNPENNTLKKYGHNIEELYDTVLNIAVRHGVKIESDDIHTKILNVLSMFGTGSRYYNLDKLTGRNNNEDPLSLWYDIVYYHIWGLSVKTRKRLQDDAIKYTDALNLATAFYPERNINGDLMSVCDHHFIVHAIRKANPYVVWSIVSILRPFYKLLKAQTKMLHEIVDAKGEKDIVPYMYEFFTFVQHSKSEVLKKRNWTV
ncbi:MAG: hypothetical protein ACRC2W_15385 [Plesiomonas shigelloides]